MPNSHIIGTGSSIPKRVLSNNDLETIVDTSDEWITTRTGIKERHFAAEDQAVSDLVVEAAKRAIPKYSYIWVDLTWIKKCRNSEN